MNKAVPTTGIHFVNVTDEGVEIIGENGDKTVIFDTERLSGMAYAIIGVLEMRARGLGWMETNA